MFCKYYILKYVNFQLDTNLNLFLNLLYVPLQIAGVCVVIELVRRVHFGKKDLFVYRYICIQNNLYQQRDSVYVMKTILHCSIFVI